MLETPNTNTSVDKKQMYMYIQKKKCKIYSSKMTHETHDVLECCYFTWRNIQNLSFFRFRNMFIIFLVGIRRLYVLCATSSNRSNPLVLLALQSPRLRSRMTSNLDDVTVTCHPRTIWWRHVTATKDYRINR